MSRAYAFISMIAVLFAVWSSQTTAQIERTVGLLKADTSAQDGYVLFTPLNGTKTYLLDMCGRMVHEWQSDYPAGYTAWLLPDGRLVRMISVSTSPIGDSASGGVEVHTWEGERQWHFELYNDSMCMHHALDFLPNGNLLVVAYKRVSKEKAIAAGRDTTVLGSSLWSDVILEIQPTGPTSGQVVWEWDAMDHLIQDFDSTKAGFGVVSEHPEKIDFNYPVIRDSTRGTDKWHVNAVAYNAELDQIMICTPVNNEVWIVDHSTTPEEARSSKGGRYGKGGDLLYRFGNPLAYRRGDSTRKQLYFQHDAHWIAPGMPHAGKMMVFNNGTGRRGGSFSSVDIYTLPVDDSGAYAMEQDGVWGPDTATWSYSQRGKPLFFSPFISGAGMLPNGNVFICEGARGRLFEVNPNGQIVWEYQSPIKVDSAFSQGASPKVTSVFRAYKYPASYPAFAGRDLGQGFPLEANPTPYDCVFDTTTSVQEVQSTAVIDVYPNPFTDQLTISTPRINARYQLFDVQGSVILNGECSTNSHYINTEHLPSGVYILAVDGAVRPIVKHGSVLR